MFIFNRDYNLKKIGTISLIVLAVIFLSEDALLAINHFRNDKPILGLKLYDQSVSRLDKLSLAKLIRSNMASAVQPLTLTYNGLSFLVTNDDVGASYDLAKSVNQIMSEGRRGSLFSRVWQQNKAILGLNNQIIPAILSKDLLAKKIGAIAPFVLRESVPITPDFVNDINKTLLAKDGRKVDVDKLAVIIMNNIFKPPVKPTEIPTVSIKPTTHDESELEAIRKEVPNSVAEPISISSAKQIFTLTPQDLTSLLKIVERPDPKNPLKLRLVLRLNEAQLNKKLGEFANKVEEITQSEFNYHDARVAIYSQFYSQTRSVINIPTGQRVAEQMPLGSEKTNGSIQGQAMISSFSIDNSNTATSGKKFVYLTFDDGPNDIYHPLILDILKKYNIKATFFLVGLNSKKYDSITQRTVAEGHVIGNHSLTHAFLPKLNGGKIVNEIEETQKILKLFNDNADITLFRPPYGGVNKLVKSYARDLNLRLTLWDVDPKDWSEPTVDELVRRIISHTHNGANILMHSNHLVTVQALPTIIEQLQSLGYDFRLLSQNK